MVSLALSSLKKGGGGGGGRKRARLLITVNVMGSAGPIRFLVNEGDPVRTVIATALRCYAREGRLPVLGSNVNDFLLYSAGSDALNPEEPIYSGGSWTFLLCKKQQLLLPPPQRAMSLENTDEAESPETSRKLGGGSWKSWINKSFNFKVASH